MKYKCCKIKKYCATSITMVLMVLTMVVNLANPATAAPGDYTWTKHDVSQSLSYESITSSADGSKLAGVESNGAERENYLYTGVMEPFPPTPVPVPSQNIQQPSAVNLSEEALAETGTNSWILITGGIAFAVLGCVLFRNLRD